MVVCLTDEINKKRHNQTQVVDINRCFQYSFAIRDFLAQLSFQKSSEDSLHATLRYIACNSRVKIKQTLVMTISRDDGRPIIDFVSCALRGLPTKTKRRRLHQKVSREKLAMMTFDNDYSYRHNWNFSRLSNSLLL